jgi:nicotinamidase-related amidase
MKKTALLVIDVQKGLDDPSWGKRNNPDAESNIASLLSAWREHELPVIHIRHCSTVPNSPLRPELPGNGFKEEAQPLPEEKQFSKSVNSAFIGTELEKYLQELYSADDIHKISLASLNGEFCIVRSTEEVLKEIA